MVQHLALDVERFWFGAVVAGDDEVMGGGLTEGDEAWQVAPEVPVADVLDCYRQEAELADAALASTAGAGCPRPDVPVCRCAVPSEWFS